MSDTSRPRHIYEQPYCAKCNSFGLYQGEICECRKPNTMNDLSDLTQKLIAEQTVRFLNEKEQIIRTTLWKATGVELDIKQEMQRIFPRLIAIRQEGGAEVWYWNNSTASGLRLITFYREEPQFNWSEPLKYEFTISERYQIP